MSNITQCTLKNCKQEPFARGWCCKHYNRFLRHGDPLFPVKERTRSGVPNRYLLSQLYVETDACILWPYGKTTEGYGIIKHNNKTVKVHRLVLALKSGSPRSGQITLHSCTNKGCFNYRHLRWGTDKDNSKDKLRDGTMATGERNPKTKTTEEEVRFIRGSSLSSIELGHMFGLCKRTILDMKNRKTWKYLD